MTFIRNSKILFAILVGRTARIYLNEISTESAYIIDYEYPIFSLAQTPRFAVKVMKRPSHKHGSIAHTTLGNRTECQLEKMPPIYLENISVESPSSIDYKYVRFRLAQIRRFILHSQFFLNSRTNLD